MALSTQLLPFCIKHVTTVSTLHRCKSRNHEVLVHYFAFCIQQQLILLWSPTWFTRISTNFINPASRTENPESPWCLIKCGLPGRFDNWCLLSQLEVNDIDEIIHPYLTWVSTPPLSRYSDHISSIHMSQERSLLG